MEPFVTTATSDLVRDKTGYKMGYSGLRLDEQLLTLHCLFVGSLTDSFSTQWQLLISKCVKVFANHCMYC